jgi:hypothetical protein
MVSYASSKRQVDGITFNAAGLHPLGRMDKIIYFIESLGSIAA